MFDKIKFSLLIAFNIIFNISVHKKGVSSLELSNEFGLRQVTCWEIKKKLQEVRSSSGNHKLTGEVHIDECWIGGPDEEKRGRSHGNKKMVVVALEIVKVVVGREYAQVIENATAKFFLSFFEKHIDKGAQVKTDEWIGHAPLKKVYKHLTQIPSDSGKGFPDLHVHIMNIKGWLRGIHHHCSKEHLQGYLNEYHLSYTRRNNMGQSSIPY